MIVHMTLMFYVSMQLVPLTNFLQISLFYSKVMFATWQTDHHVFHPVFFICMTETIDMFISQIVFLICFSFVITFGKVW